MELDNAEVTYRVTPKGFLTLELMKLGVEAHRADNLWYQLEAFCVKRVAKEHPNAEFASLVFDGEGGDVVGLNRALLE